MKALLRADDSVKTNLQVMSELNRRWSGRRMKGLLRADDSVKTNLQVMSELNRRRSGSMKHACPREFTHIRWIP